MALDAAGLAAQLMDAGCVAASDEAVELIDAAGGDEERLRALVDRRVAGEPLAWIVGRVVFCGVALRMTPGVYVPRWQSETVARRAASLLPPNGVAIDVCTGSGAIAAVLGSGRPDATIVACDIDGAAVACARSNGVEAFEGDLFAAIPPDRAAALEGRVDVITAVAPYVPRPALKNLPGDTLRHEPLRALDGGADGLDMLRRIVTEAPRWLRPGAWFVTEIGWGQVDAARAFVRERGFGAVDVLRDPEDDICGIAAVL
jgi:release factor glutamine methyltransferase